MIDVLYALLMNRRFVIAMSIVWIACSWIARRQSKLPATLGIGVHGILALSPILAISAYGFSPDIFQFVWHLACTIAHAALSLLPIKKGKNRSKTP